MSETVLKVAAKAVIINNEGRALIVREANTYVEGTNIGKWGVSGGRIQNDELFHDGLRREVREETGLDIEIDKPVYVGEWWPEIHGTKNHIVAVFVTCKQASTEIKLSEEHDAYAWVDLDSMGSYNIMPPDDLAILKVLEQA